MAHRRRSARQVRQHKYGMATGSQPQWKSRKQARRETKQLLRSDPNTLADEM